MNDSTGIDICLDCDAKRLIEKVEIFNATSSKKVDLNEIKRAIYYAKMYLADYKTESGESFYAHSLSFTELFMEKMLETKAIVFALLHDVVAFTKVTIKMIEEWFDEDVASLVKAYTKKSLRIHKKKR